MSNEDEKLAALLRQDMPPARDPIFRIKVVERRERTLFRRRMVLLLMSALTIFLLLTFAARNGGKVLAALGITLFGVAMVAVLVTLFPYIKRMLWRFRM